MIAIRVFVAEEGTNHQQQLVFCGDQQNLKPASVIVNHPQSNGIWTEKCKLTYIAGSDTKGADNHINSLTFYFHCRD